MIKTSSAANSASPGDRSIHCDDGESLHFERRRAPRRPVRQRVTAAITSLARRRNAELRICSLLLTDLSLDGAGAMVQEPLPLGAAITVFCPPHGARAGFDLQGTIVRCRRNHNQIGYNLGIHVDARLAA